jgi:hypothetical protein
VTNGMQTRKVVDVFHVPGPDGNVAAGTGGRHNRRTNRVREVTNSNSQTLDRAKRVLILLYIVYRRWLINSAGCFPARQE